MYDVKRSTVLDCSALRYGDARRSGCIYSYFPLSALVGDEWYHAPAALPREKSQEGQLDSRLGVLQRRYTGCGEQKSLDRNADRTPIPMPSTS
jgi:hypothetical protein